MKYYIIAVIILCLSLCGLLAEDSEQEGTELAINPHISLSVPGQGAGPAPASFPNAEGAKGDNPWNKILFNLLNQLAAIIVPSAVGAILIWVGKKIGWDIPGAVNTALEAAILECIAQINNSYRKRKSPEQLKELAVQMVQQALPNKLMKVLLKKYKTVDAAVEYFYRKSFKKG